MPNPLDDSTVHPAQVGGAPTALDIKVFEASGEFRAYRLPVGMMLSFGREPKLPDALLDDIGSEPGAEEPDALTARWPHLRGLKLSQIKRHALGADGFARDMAVSDHAAVIFFDPATGWTAVNTSGSGKNWGTQRWTHFPATMPPQNAVPVDDRLALWISSDNVQEHCVVMEVEDRAKTEHLSRVQEVGYATGTIDDAPPLRLSDAQRHVFVRVYGQFLQWNPPLPAPIVRPMREKEYLAAVPQARGDFGKVRTAIQGAIRNNDFLANGAGGSPTDNLHFVQRVLRDEARIRIALLSSTRPLVSPTERERIARVQPSRLLPDGETVTKTPDELALDRAEARRTLSFDVTQTMLHDFAEQAGDVLRQQQGYRAGKPKTRVGRTAVRPGQDPAT